MTPVLRGSRGLPADMHAPPRRVRFAVTDFVREGPVQPRWARWTDFGLGLLAVSGLPAMIAAGVALELGSASPWWALAVVPVHSAVLAAMAWWLVRPRTVVDTTTGRIHLRGRAWRVTQILGWGRDRWSGWVAVSVDGHGTRVVHTHPDDAELLAGALGPGPDPIVLRPDGFEAVVPGTPWICGADALPACLLIQILGYTALPAFVLTLATATLMGAIGAAALVLLVSGIAVLAGLAAVLTGLLTPVWLLSRVGWPRRVEVRGARLTVTPAHRVPGDGWLTSDLRLRGDVQVELDEGPRGARLTVRTDDGMVVIPGPNLVLRQVRDAVLAVHPTTGDPSGIPEALAGTRRAAQRA